MASTYEFGPFRLDTMKRLLLRDGEVVPLRPKAYETLLALVERHGEVAPKDYLMDRIWPDDTVEEGNLTLNIHAVRRALGQAQDDHSFIVTVPGLGYKFVAEVRKQCDNIEGLLVAERTRTNITIEEEMSARDGEIESISSSLSMKGVNRLIGAGRRRTQALIFTLTFVVAGSGLVFGIHEWLARRQIESSEPFQNIKLELLTTTGRAKAAAISPDGKYVVYVSDDAGKQSIRLRQLATNSDTQILTPDDVHLSGLTFSPDGSYVYYVSEERNRLAYAFYKVPLLGGTVKKLTIDVNNWPVAISPDGRRVALIRDKEGESTLIVANENGAEEQPIARRRLPDFFRQPAWSPDGQMIACAVYTSDAEGRSWHVIAVPVAGGEEKRVTRHGWQRVERMAWLADGSGLVLPAEEKGSGSFQIWRLAYPGGETRRITNDLSSYQGVSLTADSRVMVTVQSETISSIWVAPQGEASRERCITTGKYDGRGGLAWTPDDQIVYEAKNADGSSDLWIIEPNGGQPKRFTENAGINRSPAISPDGRFIVFESTRSGALNIWRMNQDGSNPTQLTHGHINVRPDCTADGRWVVYNSFDSGKITLWKVPIDGESPIQVTNRFLAYPVVSPDGKLIASLASNDLTNIPEYLAVMSLEEESPVRTLDLSPDFEATIPIRWTPDRLGLAYVEFRDGASNIWSQPLAGGLPRQLTDFRAERIYFFGWSRDGRQLAYARGGEASDVVMIGQR